MAEGSHDGTQAPPPSYHEALSYRPLFSRHTCAVGQFMHHHHHHLPCAESNSHPEEGHSSRQNNSNICICPQHGPITQHPVCMCHACCDHISDTECKRYAHNRRFNGRGESEAVQQQGACADSENLESYSLLSGHQHQPCCQSNVHCCSCDTNCAPVCNSSSSSNCMIQPSCACGQRNHTNVTVQFDVSNGTVKSRPDSNEDDNTQEGDDEVPTNRLWSACVVIFFIAVVVTMITVFSVFLG